MNATATRPTANPASVRGTLAVDASNAIQPRVFDTWQEAFTRCRSLDRPLLVSVEGEIGTVFPSGAFRPRITRKDIADVPASDTLGSLLKTAALWTSTRVKEAESTWHLYSIEQTSYNADAGTMRLITPNGHSRPNGSREPYRVNIKTGECDCPDAARCRQMNAKLAAAGHDLTDGYVTCKHVQTCLLLIANGYAPRHRALDPKPAPLNLPTGAMYPRGTYAAMTAEQKAEQAQRDFA